MSYQKSNFLSKNGLVLNELHSAVSFRQAWLKDYIMYVAKLHFNAEENGQDFDTFLDVVDDVVSVISSRDTGSWVAV